MQMRPEWEGDPGEIQTSGPGFITRTYHVRRLVDELRPDHLLDIGCGRGNVTRLVAPLARRVVATEISVDAARAAQRVLADGARLSVLAADALALSAPFPPFEARFDLVLLSEVLEHLDDDRRALASCYDLLRPGGRLLLTVPAHLELWTDMDVLIGHRRRYTKEGLVALLEESGFHVTKGLCWGFPLSGWLVQRGQKLRARRIRAESNSKASFALPSALQRLSTLIFHVAARLERVFTSWDRGVGYVVVAQRPEDSTAAQRRPA